MTGTDKQIQPAGLTSARRISWALAVFIPLYCFVVFPAFHELGSAVAGQRQSYFSWLELAWVSLPLSIAATGFAAGALGFKRERRWAPFCFMGALLLLILVDAWMYFFYPEIKPWYRMDGMHEMGLGASSWRFLDSLYFSAPVTGSVFLLLLVVFTVRYYNSGSWRHQGRRAGQNGDSRDESD